MGTWGAGIDEDDVFLDVYQDFMDAYNAGGDPEGLRISIRKDMEFHFSDIDDRGPALFALALACWETQALTDSLLEEVRSRIESGDELASARSRDSTTQFIESRNTHIREFLLKISKPRRAKKRRRRNIEKYESETILDLESPDGRKRLVVSRSSVNGRYQNTSASVTWSRGGGGLFGFTEDEIVVRGNWLDPGHLAIEIDGECFCQELRDHLYFLGDEVRVSYKAPKVTTWSKKHGIEFGGD